MKRYPGFGTRAKPSETTHAMVALRVRSRRAMRNTLLHTVATSLAVLTIGVSLATMPVLAAARHGGGGSHHVSAVHRGGGAQGGVQYAGHRYGGGGGNYGGGGYYSGGGYYGGCNQGYYNQGCGAGLAGGVIGGAWALS
jgi:uncharacterized membrane protein